MVFPQDYSHLNYTIPQSHFMLSMPLRLRPFNLILAMGQPRCYSRRLTYWNKGKWGRQIDNLSPELCSFVFSVCNIFLKLQTSVQSRSCSITIQYKSAIRRPIHCLNHMTLHIGLVHCLLEYQAKEIFTLLKSTRKLSTNRYVDYMPVIHQITFLLLLL